MSFQPLDIAAFVGFLLVVVGISLYASRGKHDAADYFLAGRNLPWWLIGFSLIASNISTEHFVGMAGRGYELGLAIASYEWMAAVTLVLVGLFFLPRFLQAGIYTIPEYLEFRYDVRTRTLMAAFIMAAYVFVALATVLYSGALALESIFGIDTNLGIWLIGILAGGYTIYGGLKAVVWSDLLQGVALLLGGVVVTVLGFRAMGGIAPFLEAADGKLHTVLPWNHPEMPWLAVFVGGLWIPNLFYWGLNQFITQRTLAARSLADGQRGAVSGRLHQARDPVHHHLPGDHGRRAVRRSDDEPRSGLPGHDARAAARGADGRDVRRSVRGGDELARFDAEFRRDDLQRGPVQAASPAQGVVAQADGCGAGNHRGARAGRLSVGAGGGQRRKRLRVYPDVLGVHLAGDRGRVPLRAVRAANAAGRRLRGDDPGGSGVRPVAVGAAPRSRSCTTWRSPSW